MTTLEKLNHIMNNKAIDTIIIQGMNKFDGRMTFNLPNFKITKVNNGMMIAKDDDNFITVHESYLYDVSYQSKILFIELK